MRSTISQTVILIILTEQYRLIAPEWSQSHPFLVAHAISRTVLSPRNKMVSL